MDDADKRLLEGIATRRENTEIAFYSPSKLLSEEALKSINECLSTHRSHVTAAAFYRLLAADLLPPNVHRALYLDGDMVCTGSLEELFNINLKGHFVGMCFSPNTSKIKIYNRLGYPPSDGYFTSAIMLFDLDLWRGKNIRQAMLEWLAANAKKCRIHDQDLINAVLHGRIFQLDFSYNVGTDYSYVFYWLQEEKNKYYADETQFLPKDKWDELKIAMENPRILHFYRNIKPWHRECDSPFAPVWRYFQAQSPWANERLKSYGAGLPAKARIKRLGRRALERLNLIASATIPYPQEAYAIAQRVLDRLREEDRV